MAQIASNRSSRRYAARTTYTSESDNEDGMDHEHRAAPSTSDFDFSTPNTCLRNQRNTMKQQPSKFQSSMAQGTQNNAQPPGILQSSSGQMSTPCAARASAQSAGRSGRKSVRAIHRLGESAVHLDHARHAFTKSSTSPERWARESMPLADITEAVMNQEQISTTDDQNGTEIQVGAEKVLDPPEKPMDIVIRTRVKPAPCVSATQEPKPRMVITYLILQNFKSYAGRQEVGPFHASFSSVVGPNGSGKSNVIDSLLFVFGFRASKMRQGKICSLIHNSAAYPDLDYCEVEVHFQQVIDHPSGDKEVIPESGLVVSRKAFKNNSSKYYINSSESNFTAVGALLRDHGIDLDHKRFLILQGEVESIAQMKPKAATEHDDGLLEYLEDIIGTSKYKTPIEESSAETETLNEVCHEKSNRVQHVEKERKGLESKKNIALSFIRDENELAMKQSSLWQIFVHECQDNNQVTQEAIAQISSQLDEETNKHKDSEEDIRQIEKQHATELNTLKQIEQTSQAVLKQVAKADKETVRFEEKRKHLSNKIKKIEKSQSANHTANVEAVSYLQRLSEDVERNRHLLSDLEQHLKQEDKTLIAIRDSLKGKTQTISDEINAKQKLMEPWMNQIDEKKSSIAVAQSEIQMLRDRDQAGAQALIEAQSRLETLQGDQKQLALTLEQSETEKAQCQQSISNMEEAIEQSSKQEPVARSKLSGARQKADEARASLSKSQAQGKVLSGLLRLKESGRIHGFHGRLGNLGAIDSKYDVAISTACPALDNLVVESVDVGQQCIDFLRKNNMGRANFILLDRLSHRDMSNIETPENVPRLFDLVRSKDENFLPAFYSVLQNTLVAKDLEQANRVAYGAKRWRVVTLNGQLIDRSGTMSGGGTRVARGAMSSKIVSDFSKEQVAKLEADRDEEETRFSGVQKKLQEMMAALKEAKESVPALENEARRYRLEIETVARTVVDVERRMEELKHTNRPSSSDGERVSVLESDVARYEKEIEDLQENTIGLEDEIKSLNEKIMQVGGVKLRGQKAKVDGIKEQIETLSEEVSSAEVSLAKIDKNKSKQEKVQRDLDAELGSVKNEVQRLDLENACQTKNASGSKQDAEKAQEALETKRDQIQSLKAEIERRSGKLNEAKCAEIEMRNNLEENQKILSENSKRLRYWQEKVETLTVQNMSDLDEVGEEQVLATYTRDELSDLDKNVLKGEIALLEEKTQNANVEMGVIAEYRKRVEEHETRSRDLAEAVGQRDAAKKRCEELRRIRLEGFMEGFSIISMRLKEMYQMITMGGNAELELVDSLDPFSEGILFSVMPPKKSWKNISNLSGGEKTLSSLALVFALHHYKPTPLYVMDEIDAALDFRNVSIVASYIKERTKNAQFVVISLRNNMFELASRLVGVYKVNHMTKSVTVENKDYM